ncbi:MAG: alpha/beta hydrolase [Aggregatilineales bacterium]
MTRWRSYTDTRDAHTVTGTLLICDTVHSPQLDNNRHILVWLPPSYYQSDKRYPVLYMQDGDNLFDDHSSYAGEWHVDETLTQLAADDIEAIVVGIPNMGSQRFTEYNPFVGRRPGKGITYLHFIIETLKPLIDRDFRTLPDAPDTGLVGSSMGGLISLYGFLKYPLVFGLCGALSPVFWIQGDVLLQTLMERPLPEYGRVYLDIGTQEGGGYGRAKSKRGNDMNAAYVRGVRRLRDGFHHRDYAEKTHYVEDEGAMHNEAAWSKRLPAALRFLLK